MTGTTLSTTDNYVITIGRQFGSGGRELGQMLAQRFGIDYYDKNLLADAAKRAGMAAEFFESNDERMPNLMSSSLTFSMGYGQLPWYNGAAMMTDSIYAALTEVMTTLANTRPCVIVGRSADFVLANHPTPVVSLFVHAPMPERIKRILGRTELTKEKAAQQLAEKTDKNRAEYYNFYTDKRWGDAASYDLTFNSAVMPMEDMADIIAEYIRRRFHIEPIRK
jgi:cytidylate kinase